MHIVLVTGGNTGIGYETIKALYASSHAYTILMGSRSVIRAEEAIEKLHNKLTQSASEVSALQIDIEDDLSIETAFEQVEVKWGRVDTLINNAGAAFDPIMLSKPGPKGIREAWDRAYSVNVASTQVVTHQFIPLLLKSANPCVLFVTSGLSSLATCSAGHTSSTIGASPFKGWPKPNTPGFVAYYSSKTALNMMMLNWKRLLEPDGVKVFCVSPGFLATNLGGVGPELLKKAGATDPADGGSFIRRVVEGNRDEDVRRVINKDGVQPW